MQYNDPREALQDLINTNPELKKKIIESCESLNLEQKFYADYVLIQETTFKKIVHILQQEYHTDKLSHNNNISPDIVHEISRIINSSRDVIRKKDNFKYSISDEYYNFLIELNPYAFIKAITWKEERKNNYDWYDNENTYIYYKRHVEFLDKNDPSIKISKRVSEFLTGLISKPIDEIIQICWNLKLENSRLKENKKSDETLSKMRQETSNTMTAQHNKAIELKKREENVTKREEELNERENNADSYMLEINKIKEETDVLQEELMKKTKRNNIIRKGINAIFQIRKNKLRKDKLELVEKKKRYANEYNEFEQSKAEFEWKKAVFEKKNEQMKKAFEETFKELEIWIENFWNLFSPDVLISWKHLNLFINFYLKQKNIYYSNLLSQINFNEINFKNIERIDFSKMRWKISKIFRNKDKTKNIFIELNKIFLNKERLDYFNLLQENKLQIKQLLKKLNKAEKIEFFRIFIDPIIYFLVKKLKKETISELIKLDSFNPEYNEYEYNLYNILDKFIKTINEIKWLINNDILNNEILVDFTIHISEIKEIFLKWEINYLNQYNIHSKRVYEDEREAMYLNWIELLISDLEEKLNTL